MANRGPLTEETIVVRGGKPPFARPLTMACRQHPDGYHGFSVQAGAGRSVGELARSLPNARVGFTTVGEVRKLGYDVVPTAGDGHHATLVVPADWTEDEAERLASLFQDAENPNPGRRP